MPDGSVPLQTLLLNGQFSPTFNTWLFIAILALILMSAFFSSTETAYSCSNRIKLRTYVSNGNKRAKKVLALAETNYDKFISSVLIGNNIVNLTDCRISPESYVVILTAVRNYFLEKGTPFYNNFARTGILRHLVLRKSFRNGEIMVNLVATSGLSLNEEEFVNMLLSLDIEEKSGSLEGIVGVEKSLPGKYHVVCGKGSVIRPVSVRHGYVHKVFAVFFRFNYFKV